jgi:hypothetical protein
MIDDYFNVDVDVDVKVNRNYRSAQEFIAYL